MGEREGCFDGGRGRRFWERVMVKEVTEVEVSVLGSLCGWRDGFVLAR